MASSKTEICNIALSHIGSGKEIANIVTENSDEARACRRYFDVARDIVLRDFAWPFATKIATLALVEEDPNDEWAFSYRYPSDCLELRRMLSGIRNDTRQSRVSYRVARDEDGLLIYTDLSEAECEYTFRDDEVERYPNDFVMALSWRLASYILSRQTGGDPFRLRQTVLQMYQYEIAQAKANAANEEQPDEEPESEIVRVRNG